MIVRFALVRSIDFCAMRDSPEICDVLRYSELLERCLCASVFDGRHGDRNRSQTAETMNTLIDQSPSLIECNDSTLT